MPKFFCLLLFVSILYFSCKPRTEKIFPLRERITESVYASGFIKSKNQYQVFSNVNGLIKQVLVSEGDVVKKGDPLFRLSDAAAQLIKQNAVIAANFAAVPANADKLNQVHIDIDVAKANMLNNELLLEKQRNLWSQGIGPANELDQRQLVYSNSVNVYEAAKLRYNDLQKQLNFQSKQAQKNVEITNSNAGDFLIKSEVNGKVYTVLKEQGEMVAIQNPIAIIGDDRDFIIELQIDEYDITKIRLSQKVLLTMDSYKGQVFEATISKIDPIMNAQTKSFTVEALFTNPPTTLYPNLTLEANIIIQIKEQVLTLPRNYVTDDNFVTLSNKEKRKVNIGLRDYQKVEIIDGITEHDALIKPAQ